MVSESSTRHERTSRARASSRWGARAEDERGQRGARPMSDLPQRVVLLGGSGFLGRAVGRELTRMGISVVSHSSKTLDLTRGDAADLLAAQLDQGAALFFAAALTPDRGQTIAAFTSNIAMAATVARALEQRPVPCVFVSSDAVYGFGDEPVTETTAVAPGGFYGLAKYTSEK